LQLNLPIRARLTILYCAVLALSFIAFFWICDLGFRHSIETTVNEESQADLETVRRLLVRTSSQGEEQVRSELGNLADLWANGALLEVANGKGDWLFQARQFLKADQLFPPATSGGAFFTTNLDSLQYRIASVRANVAGKSFEIRTAVPTEPFDQALDRFRIIEKEALPLLVLLAAMLGYWLSGKSLAPVNRIILTAEEIGIQNLSRRLEVPAPKDELRRLTETLNAMLSRIEASFQKITQFTADASHDLRTPVAVIRATAEITLRRRRTESEYQNALSRILETSVETSALLENLLTLARADAGAAGLEMHPLDLNVQVKNAHEQCSILAANKFLSFTLHLPESPARVRADAIAIHRLLLILIDNAVKYTPPGGQCDITLTQDQDHAHIVVKDTGMGIAEDDLDSIFERFRRADQSRSRETPGAGLGLAIARWITQMHDGEITVESKLGLGSAFHVRLPTENPLPLSLTPSTSPGLSEGISGSFQHPISTH
jgi:heavy metal sensor kinase